jgi:hypothetical protein
VVRLLYALLTSTAQTFNQQQQEEEEAGGEQERGDSKPEQIVQDDTPSSLSSTPDTEIETGEGDAVIPSGPPGTVVTTPPTTADVHL